MRLTTFAWVAAISLALCAAGCGDSGNGAPTPPPPAGNGNGAGGDDGGAEGGRGGAGGKVDPATAGSISGTVTVGGKTPDPVELIVDDAKCKAALEGEPLMSEEYVVADGKLQNVFVYVKAGLENYKFDVPKEPVELVQKGCHYEPHVLGVMAGQPLRVVNDDQLLHNVNGNAAKKNRGFNIGQQPGQKDDVSHLRVPETIAVKCDVHAWMGCFVHVVKHPKFTVTGADGSFTIEGLPPGKYTVVAWHEKLGEKTAEVTVEAKGEAKADFSFEAK